MSRRIRPPKPPVTGHPYVDNELRKAWKEFWHYLREKPIYLAVFGAVQAGGSGIAELLESDLRTRREYKKLRRAYYAASFQYYDAEHYIHVVKEKGK